MTPIKIDEATSFLTPFRHIMFEHYRLQCKDREQAITVIGSGHFLNRLLDRIAANTDCQTRFEPVPTFKLAKVVKQAGELGDLVLARVPKRLPLPRLGPRMPEMIGAVASVAAILAKTSGRESNVKKSKRLVRQSNYQSRLSNDMADFETFYDQFYLPFARARFETLALIRPREVLAKRFRKGFVQFVDGPDGSLAANLLERSGTMLRKLVFGSPLDTGEIMQRRLQGVGHYLTAEAAKTMGCTHIDFGGSSPLATDGPLGNKFSWTAALTEQRYVRWDVLAHWQSAGDHTRKLLELCPIFRSPQGGFDVIAGAGAKLPRSNFSGRNISRVWVAEGEDTAPDNPQAWPLSPAPLECSIDLMKAVAASQKVKWPGHKREPATAP